MARLTAGTLPTLRASPGRLGGWRRKSGSAEIGGRGEARRAFKSLRFIAQNPIDFDPVPLVKLAHVGTDAEPIAARAPGEGTSLAVHRDRAEVTPVSFAVRLRQLLRMCMPVGEEIERNDALAFGFGARRRGMLQVCARDARNLRRAGSLASPVREVPEGPDAGATLSARPVLGSRRDVQ